MSRSALIVIDVQRGMFAWEQQPHDGTAVLSRIEALVGRARQADVPVIFVQHDGGSGHPLEKPLENWRVHPGTGFRDGDLVVEKRHCDAFQDTTLQALLTEHDVETVVLTGMMTEFCVDTTCRRAFSLGLKVVLASDAHTTFARPHMSAELIVQHHNAILADNFASTQIAEAIDFKPNEALQ